MTKIKYIPNFLALFVFFLAFNALVQAQTYQVVSTSSSTVANNITRTITTVQVGSNPLNRFVMTRVRKDIPEHELKGTVLLMNCQ